MSEQQPEVAKYVNDQIFRTYSCRFECAIDYSNFIIIASQKGVEIHTHEVRPTVLDTPQGAVQIPDIDVEFASEHDFPMIRYIMEIVPDAHVGCETLRECKLQDNSLERISYN